MPILFSLLFQSIQAEVVSCSKLEVLFPPKDKCFDRIVELIGKAKQTIHVQCYGLTAKPISNALIVAHQRGVKVVIIADKSQTSEQSEVPELKAAGIEVVIDSKPAIAHNKIIIIDADSRTATTLTGSYNWTESAENRNAENLDIFEKQPKVAAVFLKNWQDRYSQSTPL